MEDVDSSSEPPCWEPMSAVVWWVEHKKGVWMQFPEGLKRDVEMKFRDWVHNGEPPGESCTYNWKTMGIYGLHFDQMIQRRYDGAHGGTVRNILRHIETYSASTYGG